MYQAFNNHSCSAASWDAKRRAPEHIPPYAVSRHYREVEHDPLRPALLSQRIFRSLLAEACTTLSLYMGPDCCLAVTKATTPADIDLGRSGIDQDLRLSPCRIGPHLLRQSSRRAGGRMRSPCPQRPALWVGVSTHKLSIPAFSDFKHEVGVKSENFTLERLVGGSGPLARLES